MPTSRIYEWTSSGQIPHFKLGRRTLRFSRADIIQWLSKTAVDSSKEPDPGHALELLFT